MPAIINGVWSNAFHLGPGEGDVLLNWIAPDGAPGPTGRGGFRAEPGRYHIYLAQGCPHSHRVSIAMHLCGCAVDFSVTYVDDVKRDNGWEITRSTDPVFGAASLHAAMIAAEGNLTSKSTVPVMVDKASRRIVTTSSADMVRMIDRNYSGGNTLWPAKSAAQIDETMHWIDTTVGSLPYRILFSDDDGEKRGMREKARTALEELDTRLSRSRYLSGSKVTASDVWAFTPLLRWDSIYSEIFGVPVKLSEFTSVVPYLSDLWAKTAFSATSNRARIEAHYYRSYIHGPKGPVEPGKGRWVDLSTRTHLSPNLGSR